MNDIIARTIYLAGALVAFGGAGHFLIYRIGSWLTGKTLLGWVQTVAVLAFVIIALLFTVLAELRGQAGKQQSPGKDKP